MNAYQLSLKKQLNSVKRQISDVENKIRLRKKSMRNMSYEDRENTSSEITVLEKELKRLQEDYSYIVVEM